MQDTDNDLGGNGKGQAGGQMPSPVIKQEGTGIDDPTDEDKPGQFREVEVNNQAIG